jgi:hypothetical protein
VNKRSRSSRILGSSAKMAYYRAPKSLHDPLIEVAQMVADTLMAIGGPLFWGVLVIGLLTSVFR